MYSGIYGISTEDYLFRVAAGDEDDDDYSATDESAYDITSDSKHPMKVWMSVSVDSSGGNWMMSEGGDHEKLKFGIAYIYDDYHMSKNLDYLKVIHK